MLVAFLGSGLATLGIGGSTAVIASSCYTCIYLYNYHLVSRPRNTSRSKVLTAKVPRSQHPQQARLRKLPGWLRELMLASAPDTHNPARTTWSFLLIFYCAGPPRLLFYQQLFFQGSGPGGSTTNTPSLRPQTLVGFGYCSTVVPFFLFTDIQHISPEKSRVRNLFHSERRWFTRNPARNLDSSSSSIRYQKAGYANQWWSTMYAGRVRHTRGARETSAAAAYLSARQSGR